jgi:hypothetical protein
VTYFLDAPTVVDMNQAGQDIMNQLANPDGGAPLQGLPGLEPPVDQPIIIKP